MGQYCFARWCLSASSVVVCNAAGFPTSWKVLGSPESIYVKLPGPGKFWKMVLVLESLGNFSERSWEVLEFSRL